MPQSSTLSITPRILPARPSTLLFAVHEPVNIEKIVIHKINTKVLILSSFNLLLLFYDSFYYGIIKVKMFSLCPFHSVVMNNDILNLLKHIMCLSHMSKKKPIDTRRKNKVSKYHQLFMGVYPIYQPLRSDRI